VSGDANGSDDIFVKDLQTGVIQRVSTNSSGMEGQSGSYCPQISADGRYILFHSYASNLVPGDAEGSYDIFVKDLQNGTTRIVSTVGDYGNPEGDDADFSVNGRYVVFSSGADNLVAGDTNGAFDVFVKDLQTGTIRRISTDSTEEEANYGGRGASISADGRYVAFKSFSQDLVASNTGSGSQIFVKDLQSGLTQCVSTDAAGGMGNGDSDDAQISADGRYVAFSSAASNLLNGDTNGFLDIFVKDIQTDSIRRVSLSKPMPTATTPDSQTMVVMSYSTAMPATSWLVTATMPTIFSGPESLRPERRWCRYCHVQCLLLAAR
jgi:Tol biopolymer transport system component